MENNITVTTNANQSTNAQSGKKVYQSPKLKHHGSLAEIVQSLAGPGNDAGGGGALNAS